jgi:hypothetical protein
MFLFLSFMIFFFFKIGEQEDGTCSAWRWERVRGRGVVAGEEGGRGERCRKMNMVQIMYTHVCKGKK